MQKFLRDMYKSDGSRIAYELHFKSLTSSRFENFFSRKKSPLTEDYRAPLAKYGGSPHTAIESLSNSDTEVHELAENVARLKSLRFKGAIDPKELSTYNFMGTSNGPDGPNHIYHVSQVNHLQDAMTAMTGDKAQMIRYFMSFPEYGGMLDTREAEDAAFLKDYQNPFLAASDRKGLKESYKQIFRQRESAFEADGTFPSGGDAGVLIRDSVVHVQAQGSLLVLDVNGVIRPGVYVFVKTGSTHVYDGGALHYRIAVGKDHVMTGVYGIGASNNCIIDASNVLFGGYMWPIIIDVAYEKDVFLGLKQRGEIPHTLKFDDYVAGKKTRLLADICSLKLVMKGDVFGIWLRNLVGPWAQTKSPGEFVKVYRMNGERIQNIMDWFKNPLSYTVDGERVLKNDQDGAGDGGIYVGGEKVTDPDALIDLSRETEMKKIADKAIAEAIDDFLTGERLRELNKNQQEFVKTELQENQSEYLKSSLGHAVDALMNDPRIVEPASSLLNELKDSILPALVDELFNTLSEEVPAFQEKLYTRTDIALYIDRRLREQYLPKYTLNDPLLLKDVEIAVLNAQDNVADVTTIELADGIKKIEVIEAKVIHDLDVLRQKRDLAIQANLEAQEKALEVDMKKLEEVRETRKKERLEKQSVFDEHEKERLERKKRIQSVTKAREKLEQERKGGAKHGK